MRHGIGITLLTLTLAAFTAGAAERIELKVGQKQSVTVQDLARLAIGDPGLAKVGTAGKDQVEVTGRAAGVTKLVAWNRDGDLTVYTVVVSELGKPAPAETPDETVTLNKGGTHELLLKDMKRVAVGDPGVTKVELSGKDTLKLSGLKAGETTLLVWTGDEQELRAYHLVVK